MNFIETLRMAYAMLTANKLRSSLTMLGIIIGNASVIALIGIGQGAQKMAEEQFQALGPNVLFVVPGSRKARNATFDLPRTLVLADAEAIATQVPSVKAVAPEINRRLLVSYRNQNTMAMVVGTNSSYQLVRSFYPENGRFLNNVDLERNKRVAVIGTEIADRLFPNQSPLGQSIRVKGISFQIVGVMEQKGSLLGTNQDEFVFIPLTTMAHQVIGKTSPYGLELSWINVEAKGRDSIRAATFQIENLMRLRHNITNGEDDFGVESAKQMLDIIGNVSQGLTIMLAAIAGISLVVGGIGVMNIMLVSVTERTQEIGLRKAVGAKEGDIMIQFLIEATLVSAVGGMIGIAFGVSGIMLIGAFSPLNPGISPIAIATSLGISSGIGLFFGVIPAKRAATLDPIIALRSA
ncbi:MAG: ABC transporter permease [Microcystaceae cyanobacterium]